MNTLKIKDVKTGARIPAELNRKLEEYAKSLGISKNNIILLALHEYLKVN